MLHLTLATIDTHSLQECLVGFAVMPIFIDVAKGKPVLLDPDMFDDDYVDDMELILHKGAY
jgi:hypothetical protein